MPGMEMTAPPQMALLDFFIPGFSIFSAAVQKYLKIDLNIYIPLLLLASGIVFCWQYFSEYFWGQLESYFMSTVDIRTDDEIYNMVMAWIAEQKFAQRSRRFIVNTNLNSRSWFLWRWDEDEQDEEDNGEENSEDPTKKRKALAYTPTFGSHYFWYKGSLLIFRRNQNRDQAGFMSVSEREEISLSCFGRNPATLKALILEARAQFMKRDERKTLIYRGTTRAGSTEPTWQRCLARTSRPFSTVILNEKIKQELIDDVTDYLNPNTRRWYSNRGIPYRRGYLLYGPPGTGKSSLSLALAGNFKMKIYIVSLSSVSASEENLAQLFAELPRRCVVLLEDIDTAGLTHTREDTKPVDDTASEADAPKPSTRRGSPQPPAPIVPTGRLSLSGLLNILDGVASQEGRVLIMTTNHLEKLDKALIRPGRVDMIVKFDRADKGMVAAIFRAIFAPLEGDEPTTTPVVDKVPVDPEVQKKKEEEAAARREEIVTRVSDLADEFAEKIPAHEFSPAELQGFLLKHKRSPENAVAGAEEWVVEMRKEKKEKELKEAEDKRKAEEEEAKKKEEEEKAKKEEEENEKKKEEKKKRKEKKKAEAKKKRKDKKAKDSDSDSASGSDSSSSASDSESESEAEKKRAKSKKRGRSEKRSEDVVKAKVEEVLVEAQKDGVETLLKVDKMDEAKAGADSGYGTP
jgi:mitochondrial chaperone BCS1